MTAECERQKMERSDYRFSRRDVREFTGWGDTQLKIHLHRLEEMEYLLVHRGGRGQSFVYELVFARQADSGRPVLPGLIDVDTLRKQWYDEKKSGPEAGKSGPSRPQVGGVSGCGQNRSVASIHAGSRRCRVRASRKTHIRAHGQTATTS